MGKLPMPWLIILVNSKQIICSFFKYLFITPVQRRLDAMKKLIHKQWKQLNCCNELMIETEVFRRPGALVEGLVMVKLPMPWLNIPIKTEQINPCSLNKLFITPLQCRLAAMSNLYSKQWKQLNCCYELMIENEVFRRPGASVGGW